jgi:hypothetical protein
VTSLLRSARTRRAGPDANAGRRTRPGPARGELRDSHHAMVWSRFGLISAPLSHRANENARDAAGGAHDGPLGISAYGRFV